MLGIAAFIGVVTGGGAIVLETVGEVIIRFTLTQWAGYAPSGPHGAPQFFPVSGETRNLMLIGILLIPAIGGLLSGLLTSRFAKEAAGGGTDAAIDSYHNGRGQIAGHVPIIKTLATAISLGTGGSGGREGPIAQIGAGIGSFVGRRLGLSARQRRILLAAGMGAGVASVFRAPLAGALFSAEILYRESEFEADVVIPSFISSTVAYCVYCSWVGNFGTLFRLRGDFRFDTLAELAPYTVLALVLVPAVVLYIKVFFGTARLSARLPGSLPLHACIGGLLTGGCAILLLKVTGDRSTLAVLSYGYGLLQQALDGQFTGWGGLKILLLIALFKILTTSFTISTGGSGGVFGPSMVIGGALGGVVGIAGMELGIVDNPGCFVLVGMTAFFAGAANTPISTIIMVNEITGSYHLLVPAMWVTALTFILSSRWTIFAKQVPSRAHSAAHKGEFQMPLLEKMCVREVLEDRPVDTIAADTPLADVLRIVASTHSDYFPVVDEKNRLVGVFSAHDVREYTYDQTIHQLATAADIMTTDIITLTPDEDLHSALDRFHMKNLDELPVVEREDPRKLLTMLRRHAITRAYRERLAELRQIQEEEH